YPLHDEVVSMFFPASIRTGTFAELSDAGKCLPIAAPAALLATARAFRGDADACREGCGR
ncbi:hypothetical protein, partial [Pseudomonas aeruginosa]|uniref:hypothetical protein n=1 Tax=Pseudomonas aeruginosa TaxID=287 RepID=UPI001E4B5566